MALDAIIPFGLGAAFAGALTTILILWVATYVYMSFAVMHTGKRLKVKDPELAWIPIVGKPLVLSRMAKMHWWPVLLLIGMFIPILNVFASIAFTVFYFIWWWKTTEARNMPGWITLLTLIPLLGSIWAFVLWGMLAWKQD